MEWEDVESDDMFSTDHFAGGFDGTEKAFCFSYYDANGCEYWFQLTLDEVNAIKSKKKISIQMRKAEN